MNEDSKAAVEQMIADALGKVPALGAGMAPQAQPQPAQAPVQNVEPTYPSEVPLDEYEALMVEALSWRVEAAEKTGAILNNERNNISQMKHDLLKRCINRLQIDVNKYNLFIDSNTKMIKIEKRI